MRHINIIQRNIRKYIRKLHTLPCIKYKKTIISYNSIYAFDKSTKDKNDENNKIRENIIDLIVNNKVPDEYFTLSKRWYQLKKGILDYIQDLVGKNITINKIELLPKAGRKYNYDFEIIVNDIYNFNVEFKYNASKLSDIPQFVSPSKPSQYMSGNYEEYYYTEYLPLLSSFGNLIYPDKKTYLKQINCNRPKCMITYKELYKTDDIFKQLAKKCSEESIEKFIQSSELKLNIDVLSEYLENSQKNKIYMLYKKGIFYKAIPDMNDYKLVSYIKEKNRFVVTNVNGTKIYVLLRWKNGNGIACPAFQIS